MTDRALTRRHALAGAAGVGLGVPLLAACGGGSGTTANDSGPGGAGGAGAGGGGATGTTLGAASGVAVGSGTIYTDENVVVTQPTKGDFKCFSATCTHQGCQVSQVTSTINCGCHGSQFSIEDGSVVQGPATAPLPEKKVTVKGGKITLA